MVKPFTVAGKKPDAFTTIGLASSLIDGATLSAKQKMHMQLIRRMRDLGSILKDFKVGP